MAVRGHAMLPRLDNLFAAEQVEGRVGEPGWPCGRRGRCSLISGSCGCYTGYTGPDCGECARDYARVDEHCVPLLVERATPWWVEWSWLLILLAVLLCCCCWCGVVAAARARPGRAHAHGIQGLLLGGQERMVADTSHLAVLDQQYTPPRAISAMSKAAGRNARVSDFVRPDRMARGPHIRRASCDGADCRHAAGGAGAVSTDAQQRRVRSLLHGNGVWRGRRGASVDGAVSRTAGRLLSVGSGRLRQRPDIAVCDSFEPCSLFSMAADEAQPLLPRGASRPAAAPVVLRHGSGSDGAQDDLLALEGVSGGILDTPRLAETKRYLRSLPDAHLGSGNTRAGSSASVPPPRGSEHEVDGHGRHRSDVQVAQGEPHTDPRHPLQLGAVDTPGGDLVMASAENLAAQRLNTPVQGGAGSGAGATDFQDGPTVPAGALHNASGVWELAGDHSGVPRRPMRGDEIVPDEGPVAHHAALHGGGRAGPAIDVQNRPAEHSAVEVKAAEGRSPVIGPLRARYAASQTGAVEAERAAGGRATQAQPSSAGPSQGREWHHGGVPDATASPHHEGGGRSAEEVIRRRAASAAGGIGAGDGRGRPALVVEDNRPTQAADGDGVRSSVAGGLVRGHRSGAKGVPAGHRGAATTEIQPADRPESLLFEILGNRQHSPYTQVYGAGSADSPRGLWHMQQGGLAPDTVRTPLLIRVRWLCILGTATQDRWDPTFSEAAGMAYWLYGSCLCRM